MDEHTPTPAFTVVVPCYNEAEAVEDTLGQLRQGLADAGDYELIVVDDGSTDGTGELLRRSESSGRYPGLRVVEHAHNQGYGAAVKSGIRRASSATIAIIDADGTYPAEVIPQLLEEAEGAEMVVGARTGDNVSHPFARRIPKLFLRAYASWLVGRQIPDLNSGLRVFQRAAADRFLRVLPDGFSLTTTLTVAMMRAGYEVRFVPIDYAPRIGRSKIQPVRDTLRFTQLVLRTGMYFAPLRVLTPLVALLGLGFLISLGYDVWVLRDLTDKTVLLLFFAMNTALFALLADMIDKRSHG